MRRHANKDTDMLHTYQGSCHCGAVRFAADIDLQQGTVRCNCSICVKLRCWSAIVQPAALRLLAGADALSEYRFHSRREQHVFCRHCGVRPFGIGISPRWGRFYGVSVSCLDDVPAATLAATPITYVDGRHDRWSTAPDDVAHL